MLLTRFECSSQIFTRFECSFQLFTRFECSFSLVGDSFKSCNSNIDPPLPPILEETTLETSVKDSLTETDVLDVLSKMENKQATGGSEEEVKLARL